MYVPGDHYVICDRCGCKIRRSQARKTWEGLLVCPKDWEPKHPQLSMIARADKQSVIDARPDVGSENFISANDVTTTNLGDPDAIGYTNPYLSSTITIAAASKEDTKIYVDSVSGLNVGDSIGITFGNDIVWWTHILYISAPIVYIYDKLYDDVASGSTIYNTIPSGEHFITEEEDPEDPYTADGWVSYFSDSYWEADDEYSGTWTGSRWNAGNENGDWAIDLRPTGDWEIGFRPTRFRITGNYSSEIGDSWGITATQGGDDILYETFYSGKEYDLTFSGYDIQGIDFDPLDSIWYITNMEFYIG